MDAKISDIVLSDGRELSIDFNKITLADWREMIDPARPEERGDKIAARIVGLSDQIVNLSFPDGQRIFREIFHRAQEERTETSFVDGSPLPVCDLSKINMGEWRSMIAAPYQSALGDPVLARVSGIDEKKIPLMTFENWRRLWCDMMRKAKNPMANPT